MKKVFAIASLVVGVIGLALFSKPIPEIICGGGGLLLSILGKEEGESEIIQKVREWGNNVAWVNIGWVILEFILKAVGVEVF